MASILRLIADITKQTLYGAWALTWPLDVFLMPPNKNYLFGHLLSLVFQFSKFKQMTPLLYCNVPSTNSPHILDSLWQTVCPRKVRSWVSYAPTTSEFSKLPHFLVVLLTLAIFLCRKNPTYMCHWSSVMLDFDQIIFCIFTDRLRFQRNFTSSCPFAISFLPDNKVRMSDTENEMDARFEV